MRPIGSMARRCRTSAAAVSRSTGTTSFVRLKHPSGAWGSTGSISIRPIGRIVTPIDEQLEAMDRLIEAGKIRYFGTSNETPWGLTRMCAQARATGSPGPVSVQNAYNLLQRNFELGLDEACREENVGMIAFSPLAMGLLTGKYSKAAPSQEGRLTQFARYGGMYLQERMIACADSYVGIACRHGLDPIEMAFAWAASRLGVAAILTSCSRLEQIEPTCAAPT